MILRSLVRSAIRGGADSGPDSWRPRVVLWRWLRLFLLATMLPLSGCIIPVEGDVRNATAADPIGRAVEPDETIVVAASVSAQDGDGPIDCVRNRLGSILPDSVAADTAAYRAIVGGVSAGAEVDWIERMTALADDDISRTRLASQQVGLVIEVISFHSNRWMSDHPTTPITSEESEYTSFKAYILDVDGGTVAGPVSVTVAGEGFTMISPLILSGWTPVTEGPACRHMAAMLASTITGRPLSEFDTDLAEVAARDAEESKAREEQRLRDLAKSRDGFLEMWAQTCKAALGNRPQAVNGYNALWLGGTYRFGNAPGGADPARAMAWFAIASDTGQQGADGSNASHRFVGRAEQEYRLAYADSDAEARDVLQAILATPKVPERLCNVDGAASTNKALDEWHQTNEAFDNWWRMDIVGEPDHIVGKEFLRLCGDALEGGAPGFYFLGWKHEAASAPAPHDDVEAYKWFVLAQDAGHALAEERLKALQAELSASEIAEAERRAADWWPDPSQCVGILESAETL